MTTTAAVTALVLSVGLLCARQFRTAVAVCVMQAVAAALALSNGHVAVALIAFLLNGVVLPLALMRAGKAPEIAGRGRPILWWIAVIVALVSVVAAIAKAGSGEVVALGVSVALLGLLAVGLRSHGLVSALGFLSAQNGLVLVASGTPEILLPAVFVVAVPLVPAIVFADSCR